MESLILMIDRIKKYYGWHFKVQYRK